MMFRRTSVEKVGDSFGYRTIHGIPAIIRIAEVACEDIAIQSSAVLNWLVLLGLPI